MIALRSHAFRNVLTIGRDDPSFARGNSLAWVEREASKIADRADRRPLISGSDRTGGVFDYCNAVGRGNSFDFIDRSGEAEQVYGNYGARSRRDRGLQGSRRNIER